MNFKNFIHSIDTLLKHCEVAVLRKRKMSVREGRAYLRMKHLSDILQDKEVWTKLWISTSDQDRIIETKFNLVPETNNAPLSPHTHTDITNEIFFWFLRHRTSCNEKQ